MKNLPSALMWGGLALFLFPVALVCAALIVALAISSPTVGFIVLVLVASFVVRLIERKKKGSPE